MTSLNANRESLIAQQQYRDNIAKLHEYDQAYAKRQSFWEQMSALDKFQLSLDGVGMTEIPVAAQVADALNVGISLGRGNWADAGLSAIGIVPVFGTIAVAGKTADRIDDVASVSGKYSRRVDVSYRSADEVNSTFPPGWESPYKPGTRVTEFTTSVDDIYVRAHLESNKARSWMMKREAIEGLTPQQIQSKYGLPEVPIYVSEVHVPAGTRIRTGTVNPVFDGVGNAIQYELLQRLPESLFMNTVRIGQ